MNVIERAPRPKPKILPPTSNASPSFDGRSAASVSARVWSSSPRFVRCVELLEEIGGADPLDDARQVLDQVPDGSHERAHEQVGERAQEADQAEYHEHRRVAAFHPASIHEPRDRRGEHDRQEERDEDPEDGLTCGNERPHERDHAQDGRHRPGRDRDLDPLGRRLRSCHVASLGPASAGLGSGASERARPSARCGRRR